MDELSQWCEIDGHDWYETHLPWGPPKSNILKIVNFCRKCHASNEKFFVPYGTKIAEVKERLR